MTRSLLPGAAILIAVAGGVAAVNADHHEASSSPDVAAWADCAGPVSVWRENELTETGSMAGFLEAARGHQAWLDSKGYDVRIRNWTAFEVVPQEERPGKRIAFGSRNPAILAVDLRPEQISARVVLAHLLTQELRERLEAEGLERPAVDEEARGEANAETICRAMRRSCLDEAMS